MMRVIYLLLAFVNLALGLLGIILPVLPTTPFLLLTLYLFSKSSIRFHRWFINTSIYKKYLHDFVENKAMTRKQKWTLMIFVDIVLLISFIMVDSWSLRLLIIFIDVIKYVYFFTKIKTITT